MSVDPRPLDAATMERVLKADGRRCCYCQGSQYTLSNPMIQVAPAIAGRPALVAHAKCDEPVQAWRKRRM